MLTQLEQINNKLYLRKVIVYLQPPNANAKKIDGLRINFEVGKTNKSEPNRTIIKIYNLNKDSRSFVEQKNLQVILEAGYESETSILFKGNITKPIHDYNNNVDIITTLEAGDGDNRYRNAKINKSYPPESTIQDILESMIDEFGLKIGTMYGIPDKRISNGISFNGLIKDRLNEFTAANDLEWSIQNEKIQIIPAKKPISNEALLINPNTGLIGSPSKTKDGVEFKTFLMPKAIPTMKVKLESKMISGYYRILDIRHVGDNMEGEYCSQFLVSKYAN